MLKGFWLTCRRSCGRGIYLFLSVIVAAGICVISPQPTQAFSLPELILRGIQVIQLSNMSDRQEVTVGRQINQQLANREFRIDRDRATTAYINRIGQRLAQESDRPDIPYTFQVIDDNNINAFATMGGFVYVNKGLMAAADNEAELASVIAHEIGHISARHSIKQMRQMAIASGVASATGLDGSKAVQIGVELALRRPHSRQAEYEADQLGLQTMGRSGYAQSGMVDFMKKLLNKPSPPSILSTHPATSDRIAAISQAIDPDLASGEGLNNAAYKLEMRRLLRS
ncbi:MULTISPECIES: M48 family metallopeptidase [unclassified Microcoleus]|jgi:predicted Zn-dependent protease|uniref:M48 family metallopeptidase n=1 Tax=unclassified Microcoleus TaxID=2642155 RepID=UPI001D897479|nr:MULTISPECIES: M48 family metallopeptidase [unclassified Microcoleus]MCC3444913.1 M48 family metalloprotease [Microcoleus sp. PH2017_03_ELD_O_A]MCC3502002.1 M48 family metalloprotease [Microcoleus sp. PH2017_19_SFW_U_A]TAG57112.1 MAG: M48 family peptidase [Oscillatoriales cyanobacterium]MCC3520257.1 M48 family metalloprotease [Microcoleus sp. PH2017_20_SFW_D_A]MCC3551304.1 M48 family metalloprotease [Microcoleus sp. PH2017_35_SFW_U_B]